MRELSLHILDLAQNSVVAGASALSLLIEQEGRRLRLVIEDNGCGMEPDFLAQVCDPFVTTRKTRSVGLGIPLFRQAAEDTGGSFDIRSAPGKGTRLQGLFNIDHLDMMPLGDLGGTFASLVQCNPEMDISLSYTVDGRAFKLSTQMLRDELGDVPLSTPEVVLWIGAYIREQTEAIEQADGPQ